MTEKLWEAALRCVRARQAFEAELAEYGERPPWLVELAEFAVGAMRVPSQSSGAGRKAKLSDVQVAPVGGGAVDTAVLGKGALKAAAPKGTKVAKPSAPIDLSGCRGAVDKVMRVMGGRTMGLPDIYAGCWAAGYEVPRSTLGSLMDRSAHLIERVGVGRYRVRSEPLRAPLELELTRHTRVADRLAVLLAGEPRGLTIPHIHARLKVWGMGTHTSQLQGALTGNPDIFEEVSSGVWGRRRAK